MAHTLVLRTRLSFLTVNPSAVIEFRYSLHFEYRSWIANKSRLDGFLVVSAEPHGVVVQYSHFPSARPRCCLRRQKNACGWMRISNMSKMSVFNLSSNFALRLLIKLPHLRWAPRGFACALHSFSEFCLRYAISRAIPRLPGSQLIRHASCFNHTIFFVLCLLQRKNPSTRNICSVNREPALSRLNQIVLFRKFVILRFFRLSSN